MSKDGNWVKIDKGAIKTLGNIGRPYSVVEALFSHTVDVDCGRNWTINGYAKLWDWSRGKVRRFLESLRTHSGHIADRKGTQSGHPVHLIERGSRGEADNKRTISGHKADSKRDTTIETKTKTKKELPEWIDHSLWFSFLEMRTKLKAPMTDKAKALCICKLSKLEKDGHCSKKLLEKSIMNSWKGIFPDTDTKKTGNWGP